MAVFRIMAIIGHVPWAAAILQRLPLISQRINALRTMGVSNASRRIKTGSSVRDLWHYLVSTNLNRRCILRCDDVF